MKKIMKLFSILITVGVLTGVFSLTSFAGSENLIMNGDFETSISGTTPDGWNKALLLDDMASAYRQEGLNHYIGLSGSGEAVSQTVDVEGGQKYCLEFSYRSSVASSALIYIYWRTADNVESIIPYTSIPPMITGGVWQSFTTIIESPADAAKAGIFLRAHPSMPSDSELSFDNIVMYRTDSSVYDLGNYDMEDTDGGFIKGFSKSGSVSMDTNTVFGNSTRKIKIANETNVVSKAETIIVGDALETGDNVDDEHFEIRVKFAVDSLAEGNGVKIVLFRKTGADTETIISETGYFKKTTADYAFFRTAMVSTTEALSGGLGLRLEFSGKGTAYFDDIKIEKSRYYVNPGFDGLTADGVPLGWEIYTSSTKRDWITDLTDTTTEGFRLVETAEGNYVWTYSCSRAYVLRQVLGASLLTLGDTYKVTIAHKSNANGLGFYTAEGSIFPRNSGDNTHATWTSAAPDWKDAVIYAVHSMKASFYLGFRPHNAGDKNCYFDNVRIERVTEGCTFKKNGIKINSIESGDIDVTYVRPETNYDNPFKTTVVTAVYKYENSVKSLDSLYVDQDVSGSVFTPAGVPTTTYDVVGALPILSEHQVKIPEDGRYEIQVFSWDGFTLKNNIKKVVLK